MKNDDEYISKGNKYSFIYFSLFLFIHLGIVIPAKEPSVERIAALSAQGYNQEIQKIYERRLVEVNHGLLKRELEIYGVNVLLDYSEEDIYELELDDQAVQKRVGREDSIMINLEKRKAVLLGELQGLEMGYVEISKELRGTAFSLPVLKVGIEERVILLLYPGFVLMGLLGLFWYRRDYLKEREIVSKETPLWAYPVPLKHTKEKYPQWLLLNSIGITVPILLLYLVIDFLLWTRDINSTESITVNIAFVLMISAVYLVFLIKVILIDFRTNYG